MSFKPGGLYPAHHPRNAGCPELVPEGTLGIGPANAWMVMGACGRPAEQRYGWRCAEHAVPVDPRSEETP